MFRSSGRAVAQRRALMCILLCATASLTHAGELGAGSSKPESASPMPKLSIRWDCGDCEQNPKVAPLISDSYEKEVAEKGLVLSSDETVEVSIIDYRQRHPANRIMFGIMAGKDRLGVRINYRGNTLDASDYSANILEGMNALCESVARKSFQQILDAKGGRITNASPSISNAGPGIEAGTTN